MDVARSSAPQRLALDGLQIADSLVESSSRASHLPTQKPSLFAGKKVRTVNFDASEQLLLSKLIKTTIFAIAFGLQRLTPLTSMKSSEPSWQEASDSGKAGAIDQPV
ncbi:hypothetical protein FRC09_012262, partial [Ceratobasidium sp. 395]